MGRQRIRKFVAIDCWPLRIPSRFLPPHILGRSHEFDSRPRDFTSDADLFRQQSVVVTSLYSRHLISGPPVMATVWGARIFVHDRMADGTDQSWGDEPPNDLGDFESCHAEVDRRIICLADLDRRVAMLSWLHAKVMQLAESRGWPVEAFDRAYRLCQEDDLRFLVAGKAKANPGRTRRALPTVEIDGNGDGWLTIAIENRDGDSLRTMGPWDTPTAERTWSYVLRSLHWTSSTSLAFNHWPESADWPGAPDALKGIEISVE